MRRAVLLLVVCASMGSCSDDTRPPGGDGTVPGEGGSGGPGLTGTVKDAKNVPVDGAQLEVGTQKAYTSTDGKYTLDKLTPGSVSVKLTQHWFKEKTVTATVNTTGLTTLDITIEEHPLKIDPADKTLATTFNQTFDYSKSTISIVVLPKPSRKELDNAVYYRNPTLFRDTSAEPAVTPAAQPTIAAGVAKNFTFKTQGGTEALVGTTIVDKLDATPLTAAEKTDWMMWRPMMTWLKDWDATKVGGLNEAGIAVAQQNWGSSNAVRPQAIEQVFVHGKELWVQVVFERFVKLGAGITDTDGDGRMEIYAKLTTSSYTEEIVTKLTTGYVQPTFDTHGMSKEINKSLNELYSSTAAEVERYIGQPFEVPNVGTINYPFVVLKHSGGDKNVLLVGP